MKKLSTKTADTETSYFRYWGKVGKEKEGCVFCHLLLYNSMGSLWSKKQQGWFRQ